MEIKTILFTFLLISSIVTRNDNPKKFLSNNFNPISFLNELKDESKIINIKCLFAKDYNIYSLQALQNKETDHEFPSDKGKILFNFCQNTVTDNTASMVYKEGETLTKYAGSIDGEGDSKNVWTQMGESKSPEGLSIKLVKGGDCKLGGHHQVDIEIKCDSKVEYEIDTFSTEKDTCIHHLKMKSMYGCPLGSSYLFLKLMNQYKVVFCIVFIIIGLLLCFVGNRYFKVAIIIICGFVCCYGLTIAILNFFPKFITSETGLFICLGVSLLIGLIVGFLLRNCKKLCVGILGGFIGFAITTFIYQIVQTYINIDPKIGYYVCMGICILVCAVLGFCLAETFLILGTSVFGGYLVMRGITLVVGHYLDEGLVIDLIKNGEWEELAQLRSGWIYGYLAIWGVLAIVGIIIQCKYKPQEDEEEK